MYTRDSMKSEANMLIAEKKRIEERQNQKKRKKSRRRSKKTEEGAVSVGSKGNAA